MQGREQAQQRPSFPWVGCENDCDHPFQIRTKERNYHRGLQAKGRRVCALFLRLQWCSPWLLLLYREPMWILRVVLLQMQLQNNNILSSKSIISTKRFLNLIVQAKILTYFDV